MKSEASERFVVRQGHGRHGRRFRADHHGAVGRRREPVVAIADIELRPVEAETQHRAGRAGSPFVGNDADARQHVVVRLYEALSGDFPLAVHGKTMVVGNHIRRATMGNRTCEAGMRQRIVLGIALQVPFDPHAQILVHFARFRQRQLHQRDREGSFQDRFIGEDQHPLDLPLHLRLQIQR